MVAARFLAVVVEHTLRFEQQSRPSMLSGWCCLPLVRVPVSFLNLQQFLRASDLEVFVVGGKYTDGSGFKIIGAHTDSPNLKLKPKTKRSANGVIQLNVESYGGGLWHTWFDRDLSLAGRVIVRNEDGTYTPRLVRIDRPILRIPNLCIHLRSPDGTVY